MDSEIVSYSEQLSHLIENQEEILIALSDVNATLQYQANQFHFLLVGLLLVFTTYLFYRVIKNFY